MVTKTCLYCGRAFAPQHGNSNYCPGQDCALRAKLERQNKNYEIGSDAKKAIQKNYKIISKILGNNKSGEFKLLDLLKLGFDHNGYYEILITDKKKNLYKVHSFYFHITSEQPQKIQLWKI